MFWSFGTAPEGTFSAIIFPSPLSTITNLNTNIDNIFSTWYFRPTQVISESWGILPL